MGDPSGLATHGVVVRVDAGVTTTGDKGLVTVKSVGEFDNR